MTCCKKPPKSSSPHGSDGYWRPIGLGRLEGIVEYGEGPVNIVSVVELANATVKRASFYFADPFQPPAERVCWSDAPVD